MSAYLGDSFFIILNDEVSHAVSTGAAVDVLFAVWPYRSASDNVVSDTAALHAAFYLTGPAHGLCIPQCIAFWNVAT